MLPRTKNRIFTVIIVYAMLQWAFTAYAQQPDAPPDADEPEAQPDTSSAVQPLSQPEVHESAEAAENEEEPDEPTVDVAIELPPPQLLSDESPTEGEEQTGGEEEIMIAGVSYFYRSLLFADERDFTNNSIISAVRQSRTYYVSGGVRTGLQADPCYYE